MHKAEKVLRSSGLEHLRAQLVSGKAAGAKHAMQDATVEAARTAEEAAMMEAADATRRAAAKIAASAAKMAADATKIAAVAKAAQVVRAEASKPIEEARVRVCKCYENMQGLVLCANCYAADTVCELSKRKQWYMLWHRRSWCTWCRYNYTMRNNMEIRVTFCM